MSRQREKLPEKGIRPSGLPGVWFLLACLVAGCSHDLSIQEGQITPVLVERSFPEYRFELPVGGKFLYLEKAAGMKADYAWLKVEVPRTNALAFLESVGFTNSVRPAATHELHPATFQKSPDWDISRVTEFSTGIIKRPSNTTSQRLAFLRVLLEEGEAPQAKIYFEYNSPYE